VNDDLLAGWYGTSFRRVEAIGYNVLRWRE